MSVYRAIVVLEYTKTDKTNPSYPGAFAQWVEQYYLETDSSVPSVVDAVISEVRAHNIAYVFVRGVIVSELIDRGNEWVMEGFSRHYWHYGTPPAPVVGAPRRCLIAGAVEPPNELVLPVSWALRHEVELDEPPVGRKLYHYIRSVTFLAINNGLRKITGYATRSFLPYVGLQSDYNAASVRHLSSVTNVPRLLSNSSINWVYLGVRREKTWMSSVIALKNPTIILTSRLMTRRVYS